MFLWNASTQAGRRGRSVQRRKIASIFNGFIGVALLDYSSYATGERRRCRTRQCRDGHHRCADRERGTDLTKLGFRLKIKAVCSRTAHQELPECFGGVYRTADWREVVCRPDVDIVAELVGGTTAARDDRRRHRARQVRRHREQGIDGARGGRNLGPRHRGEHQSRDGSQRVRRHPDPRRPARRHLGRPGHRAVRHPERHQQLTS